MRHFLLFVFPVLLLGHVAQGQDVGVLEPKLAAATDSGYCAQQDWNWFVGKELGIVVDSLSLQKNVFEIYRQDDGRATLVFFYLEKATITIEMDNSVELSYLFQGEDDPHRVLRSIRVDTVRKVHCF